MRYKQYINLVENLNKTSQLNEGWLMDVVHNTLDVVGFVPVLGEPFDIVNAILYATEGDYINAGFSLGAVYPIGGDAIKVAGRITTKAARMGVQKAAQKTVVKKVVGKTLAKNSDEIAAGLIGKLNKIEMVIPKANIKRLATGAIGKGGKLFRLSQDIKIGGYSFSALKIGGTVVLSGILLTQIWKYREELSKFVQIIIDGIKNFSISVANKVKSSWDKFLIFLNSHDEDYNEIDLSMSQI